MAHSVRIYTASYCSFCRHAKELLRERAQVVVRCGSLGGASSPSLLSWS